MIVTDQLTAWQCGECTELFRKIGMRDGDTVIDFGCGVGNYAFAAAEVVGSGGHVYALDIDPDVLNRLKAEAVSRNTPNLHPYASHEDATMDFADDFANVVLIYDLIHQTDIRQRFLEESRRVLVPGGTLSILPFHMSHDEIRYMLQQVKVAGFKRADTLVNCGLHFALDKVFSDSLGSIMALERGTIYSFINREG
jgi:ubiquinone/menaquinone biosynthesis C-methylase UbiE